MRAGRQGARPAQRPQQRRGQYRKDVPREHGRRGPRLLVDALVAFRERRRRRSGGAGARGAAAGAIAGYEARKQRAGALDFLDLLIRARDLVRDDAPGARTSSSGASATCWSTSSRTPIRCRPSCCCGWPPTNREPAERRPVRPAGAAAARCSSSAIRSSRSTGSAAPTSASIARICESLVDAGARAGAAAHVVPQRAGDPARGQRRVQRAHDRRRGVAAGRLRRAAARAAPTIRRSRRSSPCRCRGRSAAAATSRRPTLAASLPEAIGEFVRWLVQDSGWTVPEIGPTAVTRAPDPRRRRLPAVPPLHRLPDRRDPRLRRRRWSRAACRTCWSAARPSTSARRWTRCARRSPRSSGPTTALSVFATLRGPFFAVAEEELLAWHALGTTASGPSTSPTTCRAELAAVADALGVLRDLNRLRNHRPVAETIGQLIESHARPRRLRAVARRRAGAGQRAADRRAGAPVRGRRRPVVPRLRRRAARRRRPRADARGADPRGRHRRRAPDDGAQGQGTRVPGGHPRRHRLQAAVATTPSATSTRSARPGRDHAWPAGRRSTSREHNELEASRDRGRGRAPRLRRGHAGPRPAGRPGGRRRPVRQGLGRRRCRAAIYGGDETHGAPACRRSAAATPSSIARRTTRRRCTPCGPGAYATHDPVTGGAYTVVWWDPLLLDRAGRRAPRPAPRAPDRQGRAGRGRRRRPRRLRAVAAVARATRSRGGMRAERAGDDRHRVGACHDRRRGGAAGGDRRRSPAPCGWSTPACSIRTGRPARGSASWSTPCWRTCRSTPPPSRSRTWRRCRPGCCGPATPSGPPRRRWSIGRSRHALLARARTAQAAGRTCRREVSLGVVVDGVVVDGQADLLFDDGERWLVVDFKTDVEITGSEADLPAAGGALRRRRAARATGAQVDGALLRV